ncbi:MAG: hypothetical protein PHH76_03385 [Methanothrix soehngenii]|jgi:hypothetical protein|uniref:hypothetical protein n=1 Tax=Methanothrix TaxID=2222 RepID=UPI001B65C20C|nr:MULTISPECIES: hypothetical protein [Methanothrix]MBP7066970.1 hypothetical protein [Methanothrix sp.]MDD5256590.1 hypothetical protein [Methanothrix soehngenii]
MEEIFLKSEQCEGRRELKGHAHLIQYPYRSISIDLKALNGSFNLNELALEDLSIPD